MVYLVGAGPGDRELITVKALNCIKNAEVIVFDHLINASLLNDAPPDCRLIYAGKISGSHHLAQEEINAVIVKYGAEGRNVVRLKGGDPFVFGRGCEEARALLENGIYFEIVPGVSSCYSAAEYAGIPVTHRGAASSFHVITGHETHGRIDYGLIAKEEGTLVFMMGLQALDSICERLISGGKPPETPAAVISKGTLKSQRCITGTLKTIADKAKNADMPAAIIVGDVVNERTEWVKERGVLRDTKIISTATKPVSKNLRREVEKYGGELTEISIIKTVPINFEEFKNVDLSAYSCAVFSSANGVDVFLKYLRDTKTDMRSLHKMKLAAVGESTAERLEKCGLYPDFVPEKYSGGALAQLLEKRLDKDDRVLILRAEKTAGEVEGSLDRRGISYKSLPIYRTETCFEKSEALRLYVSDADYVIFSSGSAAAAFSEIIGDTKTTKLI
ncbi:MAG: uroporphyrinogen-III C-methyltransferase [Oscillospiraceae bacterium]|nr:uroporphyrinogen-III C-methyltransferase [Oscillospiraceae bacterium]